MVQNVITNFSVKNSVREIKLPNSLEGIIRMKNNLLVVSAVRVVNYHLHFVISGVSGIVLSCK